MLDVSDPSLTFVNLEVGSWNWNIGNWKHYVGVGRDNYYKYELKLKLKYYVHLFFYCVYLMYIVYVVCIHVIPNISK